VSGPADSPVALPAVFVMGPTASGKTDLAIELARRFPVDLISVDSALVYRGMDIGTAKPDPETLAAFPHALVDILEPEQRYSAARFVQDAHREMCKTVKAGRLPVLVGGTILYFNALLTGLDPLPEAQPEIRERLEDEVRRNGLQALHARLAETDPKSASRIAPGDSQRIQRALEVFELTGRPLSELQQGGRTARPVDSLRLVLTPGHRHILHERIRLRLDRMIELGFIDEVALLRNRPGLTARHPSMRSVGYRQAWEMLDGIIAEPDFRQRAIAATRQLAKRQLTWLRKMPRSLWYDGSRNGTIDRIFRRVDAFFRSGRISREVDQ